MAEEKKKEEEKKETPEGENAEGDAGEGEGEEGAKKKSPLKLILFIAGPILLIGAVLAGLYFTGIIGGGHDKHKKAEEEKKKVDETPKDLAYYTVPDLLINLKASKPGQPSFLKLSVVLEVDGQKNIETLNKLKPRIVDQFQVYLRELRVEDLQGSSGILRLREELLGRVNQIATPLKIRDVLFMEMLVQ